MSENVRTALITATAVLFGGLIAGGASIVTTIVTQGGENERIERRVDEEARGAARVLLARLSSISDAMALMLNEDQYEPLVRGVMAPQSPLADLKLVNGRLSAQEFLVVREALKAGRLYGLLLDRSKRQPLDPIGRQNIENLKAIVDKGATSLLVVADLRSVSAVSGGGP